MGLTSAIDWWEESQLRVLVLSSLIIQWLLFLSSYCRKFAIPGWFRSIIWLAYLGSDAVAIYGLATLFNRHKNQDHGSRGMLEVVWAPVLLMHLGGQDSITAYNLEDNELWTRHAATAVSQITVAVYVFSKSWTGGDKKLLQAAIILFFVGIIKCLKKPWAFKEASINNLVSSSYHAQRRGSREAGGMKDSLEAFVQKARELILARPHEEESEVMQGMRAQKVLSVTEKFNQPCELFVDLAYQYSERLDVLESFSGLTDKEAYMSLQIGLSITFSLLYTKLRNKGVITNMDRDRITELGNRGKVREAIIDFYSLIIWSSCLMLPFAAVVLFHRSHREAYNEADVKVTYALLLCSALLEHCPTAFAIVDAICALYFKGIEAIGSFLTWPGMVAQYSLIGFFARNKKHSKKMRIVSFFGCKDYLDQQWSMKSCFSSRRIADLVRRHLKSGWRHYIQDTESYWKFNDQRGQGTLEHHKCNEALGWSLKGPFDESVLLWHIATDICFCGTSLRGHRAVLSRQLSNYMMYLLFVKPDMLLPGSRRNLFTTAYDELKVILKDKEDKPASTENQIPSSIRNLSKTVYGKLKGILRRDKPQVEEEKLVQRILSKLECTEGSNKVFIHDAWVLAKLLQGLDDAKKMWEVIQGVWVEMLCFSAGRCRGYLHAKALELAGSCSPTSGS